MFTDPPLARVGLSEGEAQRQGIAVRVAKLPIAAVLRSRTISETRGFMKTLVEAGGDRIIGFPEPDSKLIGSLLIPYEVAGCCLRMNGRFAPTAAVRKSNVIFC
jgi:hypothetical protein